MIKLPLDPDLLPMGYLAYAVTGGDPQMFAVWRVFRSLPATGSAKKSSHPEQTVD